MMPDDSQILAQCNTWADCMLVEVQRMKTSYGDSTLGQYVRDPLSTWNSTITMQKLPFSRSKPSKWYQGSWSRLKWQWKYNFTMVTIKQKILMLANKVCRFQISSVINFIVIASQPHKVVHSHPSSDTHLLLWDAPNPPTPNAYRLRI